MTAFTAAGARSLAGSEAHLQLAVGNEGRLRLRGERFTVVEDFPVQIRINLEPIEDGTQVMVLQSDPFGMVAGTELRAKYEIAMKRWARHARAALGAPVEPIETGRPES